VSRGAEAGSGGLTMPIDMPPTEDVIPAEDRLYSFSIKDGTYEQLLAGLNRQTGLAILGEAPKDGKVTFVTEEELTFDALLQRVREILFEYKAHEHYWLIQKPTHLEVINVNDYYRKLGPEQIYESVEAYRAAHLPDYEIVMVIYTPTGSISALNFIRNFVPDYVRIAPLENRNAITMFALVKDIEKYLQLIEIFTPGGTSSGDIRPLAVIPVEHILPSQAWVDIQALMNLSDATSKAKPRSATRRSSARDGGVLDGMREPPMSVVPSDVQHVLIVRAMQDKIDEIKMLLPLIDVDTTKHFEPVVIPLQFVQAGEIIPIIEQIIEASQTGDGETKTKPRKTGARPKKTNRRRGSTEAVSAKVDETTLLAHPSGSALIVIGPEEMVATVRRLVVEFDKDQDTPPTFIALTHSDATALVATVVEILTPPG